MNIKIQKTALSLLLLLSSLFCVPIYTSDSPDSCDSQTNFRFLQSPSALRAPACAEDLSTFFKVERMNRNVKTAREALLKNLFYDIPRYKKRENPKCAFIKDYCVGYLKILAKAQQNLGFGFDHDAAINDIVKKAPKLADSAFKHYQDYENAQKHSIKA